MAQLTIYQLRSVHQPAEEVWNMTVSADGEVEMSGPLARVNLPATIETDEAVVSIDQDPVAWAEEIAEREQGLLQWARLEDE